MSSQDRERRNEQYQPHPEDHLPIPDNWETSFDGRLLEAVKHLLTNRQVVERLAGNNETEEAQSMVRDWELATVERLRDTAWEGVMDLTTGLRQIQAREPVLQTAAQTDLQINAARQKEPAVKSGEAPDPYAIAWNLVEHWKEALQQLGQLTRPEDLATEGQFDDYHDELNRLYGQVCHNLGLPWPPPVSA